MINQVYLLYYLQRGKAAFPPPCVPVSRVGFGGEKAIKNDQKSIKNRPKITQNRTPKEVWAALGAYRGVLVVSWGFLKAFWGVPGTSWSLLGSVLAASWGHPGGLLEGLEAPLGASWGLPVRPGSLLGLIF